MAASTCFLDHVDIYLWLLLPKLITPMINGPHVIVSGPHSQQEDGKEVFVHYCPPPSSLFYFHDLSKDLILINVVFLALLA